MAAIFRVSLIANLRRRQASTKTDWGRVTILLRAKGPRREPSTGPHSSGGNISAQKSESPLIDAAPGLPPAGGALPVPSRPPQGSPVDAEQSLRIYLASTSTSPARPLQRRKGGVVNPQAHTLVAPA